MVALDARTGRLVWETRGRRPAQGHFATSGPIAINGKVLQGLSGCERFNGEGCWISAFDIATGKLAWKFNTIAQEGTPGGDTWGKLPNLFRAGGETWIAGSYDPDLNLTYWGTAQAKPWVPASRGLTVRDKALYTSSTLALNPDTGKLAWYFQHAPGESLDLDEVFERVLVDIGDQKVVFSAGKAGHSLEARSPDGPVPRPQGDGLSERLRPHRSEDRHAGYRSDIIESASASGSRSCPSTEGGKNWQAMSYNPEAGVVIIPLSQSCMEMRGRQVEFKEGSGGTRRRSAASSRCRAPTATSASSRRTTSRRCRRSGATSSAPSFLTGVLSTAGGVAFVGDLDRSFRAFDVRTGKVLWQTRLGTSVQGFPVSFSAGGKQYIAVTTGLGGGSPRNVPDTIIPEIEYPRTGQALYVFRLRDKK